MVSDRGLTSNDVILTPVVIAAPDVIPTPIVIASVAKQSTIVRAVSGLLRASPSQ